MPQAHVFPCDPFAVGLFKKDQCAYSTKAVASMTDIDERVPAIMTKHRPAEFYESTGIWVLSVEAAPKIFMQNFVNAVR